MFSSYQICSVERQALTSFNQSASLPNSLFLRFLIQEEESLQKVITCIPPQTI